MSDDEIQPAEPQIEIPQAATDDPDYYMREKTFDELNAANNQDGTKAFYFFDFYETKKTDIYNYIKNSKDKMIETNIKNINNTLINMFSTKYNINTLVFKTKQYIPCTKKNIVGEYIEQSADDWNRGLFFSTKNNKFYQIIPNLPYIKNNKQFLIVSSATLNYLISDSKMGFNLSIRQQQMNDINIESINETGCNCTIPEDNDLICETFEQLPIDNYAVKKVLYDLTFVHQSWGAGVYKMFNTLLTSFPSEYNILKDKFNTRDLIYSNSIFYKYFDTERKTMVVISQLRLNLFPNGDLASVPIYNIIQIYPFDINEYNYTFIYIDDHINKFKLPKNSKDYYRFLKDKIEWYFRQREKTPEYFDDQGNYIHPHYLEYISRIAGNFKNLHPPFENEPESYDVNQPLSEKSKKEIDRYNLYTLGGKRRKSKNKSKFNKLMRKTRRVRKSRHSKRLNKNRKRKTHVKK